MKFTTATFIGLSAVVSAFPAYPADSFQRKGHPAGAAHRPILRQSEHDSSTATFSIPVATIKSAPAPVSSAAALRPILRQESSYVPLPAASAEATPPSSAAHGYSFYEPASRHHSYDQASSVLPTPTAESSSVLYTTQTYTEHIVPTTSAQPAAGSGIASALRPIVRRQEIQEPVAQVDQTDCVQLCSSNCLAPLAGNQCLSICKAWCKCDQEPNVCP